MSASEAGAALVLGLLLVGQLYFGEGKFEMTRLTWVLLGGTLLICGMMAMRFSIVYESGRIWWAPIVLEIVVAHCIIYIQMGIEAYTW